MTSSAQTLSKSVAAIPSVALTGFYGRIIEVETATQAGLPGLIIVGMGNKAIDEARQRVRSAITHSALEFPARKVTVNLAPAELPKDGTHLDLPIALSILVASGQLRQQDCTGSLFAGELALDGHIRPIRGAILIAEAAQKAGYTRIFLPTSNNAQAHLIKGIQIISVTSLQEVFQILKGVTVAKPHPEQTPLIAGKASSPDPPVTLDSIQGQEQAKRALIIAAAGRHNVLLSGPPGAGKTLLAKALTGLLPALSPQEVLEVTKLHSLSANRDSIVQTQPPLRAPHHSVTLTALIGGGLRPHPGDVSLAHKGVLLLDELPEYPRSTLEALRQPLEDRSITLSRLYGSITYPADCLLVATMNPCPCGFLGDPERACTCTGAQTGLYQKRLSGPLLDRIDLRLGIQPTKHEHFFNSTLMLKKQQSTAVDLIIAARKQQEIRYNRRGFYNAYASLKQAQEVFNIHPDAQKLLSKAAKALALTNRSALRTLRVARTIADLDGSPSLASQHVAEALRYRDTSI